MAQAFLLGLRKKDWDPHIHNTRERLLARLADKKNDMALIIQAAWRVFLLPATHAL